MDTIEKALKTPDTIVVDVRTPAEYMGGHVTGSINIPVNEMPARLAEFKSMKMIVLCCASGARSQMASKFLMQNNIDCLDGGTWLNVNSYLNS
jgi:rhodanese-related sulfurtransferase